MVFHLKTYYFSITVTVDLTILSIELVGCLEYSQSHQAVDFVKFKLSLSHSFYYADSPFLTAVLLAFLLKDKIKRKVLKDWTAILFWSSSFK